MTNAERKQLLKTMLENANSDSEKQLVELLIDLYADVDALKNTDQEVEPKQPIKRKYE